MSRLGFCLTWRIDVFRDKNTTVSYTSARLRQQVQFFQYWVCKMYIIFWEGKLPKHDDQATSRSSRHGKLEVVLTVKTPSPIRWRPSFRQVVVWEGQGIGLKPPISPIEG